MAEPDVSAGGRARRIRALGLAVGMTAGCFDAAALEYVGTGIGPIPDGVGGSGGDPACNGTTQGPPLVVQFRVSDLAESVRRVGVRIMLAPAHTWAGDLHVRLSAPDGGPSAPIFGDTGAGPDGDDGSDAQGPYEFADDGPRDWWTAAAAAQDGESIPAGFHRASADGSRDAVSLDAIFGGLPPERANGIWTLSVGDDCAEDTGGVASATLVINATLPVGLQAFSVD